VKKQTADSAWRLYYRWKWASSVPSVSMPSGRFLGVLLLLEFEGLFHNALLLQSQRT
jgi:hypothetical protein